MTLKDGLIILVDLSMRLLLRKTHSLVNLGMCCLIYLQLLRLVLVCLGKNKMLGGVRGGIVLKATFEPCAAKKEKIGERREGKRVRNNRDYKYRLKNLDVEGTVCV